MKDPLALFLRPLAGIGLPMALVCGLFGVLSVTTCPRSAEAASSMIEIQETSVPTESDFETDTPAVGQSTDQPSQNESNTSSTEQFQWPWNVATPAGPTAYVLDHKEFMAGLEFTHMERLFGTGLMAQVRYGLSDAITLGAAVATTADLKLFFNPKWNFYNSGRSSYAIMPWIGSMKSYSSSWNPIGLELIWSTVYDERHQLHLSMSAGTASLTRDYPVYHYQHQNLDRSTGDDTEQSWTSYTTYNSITEKQHFVRMTCAYDLQLNTEQGLTFSLSPEGIFQETSKSVYSDSSALTDLSLNVGLGYHVAFKKLGVYIGIEGGPSYSYYSNPFSRYYSAFRLAAGTLALNFKI